LAALAAELAQQYSIQTRVMAVDLAQPQAVQAVLEAVQDLPMGLFIACAGFGTSGPLVKSPLAAEYDMLAVNCAAVLTMSHHFGGRFAQQGRGGLILMSSLLAFQGVANAAHYAATKAYIQTLAEGLHHELKPLGVDVLACAPGPVQSGFAARANMQMGLAGTPQAVAADTLKALGRRMTVRPGWVSKLLEGSLNPLPRSLRVQMMSRIMGGMTAHQS
jgi:hypothetical protein